MKRFVDFLDSYEKNNTYDYLDYILLTSAIQTNINDQKLNDKNFTGHRYPLTAIVYDGEPSTKTSKIEDNDISMNNYFLNYNHSIWNESREPFQFSLLSNPYTVWQKEHEIDDKRAFTTKQVQKTRSICIDASVQCLDDIISLIDTHAYEDDVEYNIDLKSLHNIRPELIQLNSMIGMQSMKQSVLEQLIYFMQDLHIGKQRETSDFKHTVIYGPPGTGKTEVAKIIGKMYSKIGILTKNIFKKVTRNDLIAGYLGQTAIKTKKVIDECIGGVLFIDEAYSLANSDREDSYSKECLDILCEALSDHKNDLMVIIAGYEDELNDTFFKTNQGLESRFIWRFTMEPFSSKELMEIFKKKVAEIEWSFDDETKLVEKWFEDKKANFKHCGRDMELLLTYVKISHGRRVYGKTKDIRKKISMSDMNSGHDVFVKNKKITKTPTYLHGIYI